VPAPPAAGTSRPARTALTTFNASAALYPETFRAFVEAYNGSRYDDALALIDEHFTFGVDCDYAGRRLWYMTDRDAAAYWLRLRLDDHDRVDVLGSADAAGRESALGVEIARTSDTMRQRGDGVVRPRVPLIVRFSVDGRRIVQLGLAWSTPVPSFADCMP
jgi:hypothetical protein